MDSIRITITRGCDETGKGGTVVDDAAAVLGQLEDGTPVLDATLAAFATSYPIPMLPAEKEGDPPTPSMSPYRNFSYRLRMFANEVVAGFVATRAASVAQQSAAETVKKTLESVTVVDG